MVRRKFASPECRPSALVAWGTLPSENEVCSDKHSSIRLAKMTHQIQDDIQKMAVTLAGARDDQRQHLLIPRDHQTPLIPGVVLDDVVVPIRCGGVFPRAKQNDFGMIKCADCKKWTCGDA
jgi:hypothetical protein